METFDTAIASINKFIRIARENNQNMDAVRMIKIKTELILQKQKEQPLDFKNRSPEEILEFCRINGFNI